MKKEALKYMKMAQGQLNAAIKMAEDDRYCIDISHQILASISLLKKANESMLKEHMNNCLIEAFEENKQEEKLDELVNLIHKMID
ncbi:MAG TPA: metal-sensing transcriptional repressor [Erysipelothrix sp.]|nr:metal-sensing transcriptional repressor [Erysipelothrix sp.]